MTDTDTSTTGESHAIAPGVYLQCCPIAAIREPTCGTAAVVAKSVWVCTLRTPSDRWPVGTHAQATSLSGLPLLSGAEPPRVSMPPRPRSASMWTASLSSEIYCSIRLGHPAAAREFDGSGAGGGPLDKSDVPIWGRARLVAVVMNVGAPSCSWKWSTTTLTERPGRSIGRPRGWK